ncbi:MAG: AI-2E family transporter [Anaerolineae bacterium]|nr:AI-2E family transporter [Anaerolineae bacterium]
MRRSDWLNILTILLVIIAASYVAQLVLGFVSGFSDIILLLALSWLVAYVLNPLVDFLNNRQIFAETVRRLKMDSRSDYWELIAEYRIQRPVAVAMVYLGLLVLVIIAIASLIPTIVQQLNTIVPQLSNVDVLTLTLTRLFQGVLEDLNIAYNVQDIINSAFSGLQTLATPILQNTVAILTSVLALLGNVLLVLLLSFFFTLDGPRFNRMLFEVVPERLHQETRMFLFTTDRAFGGFLRGQILQAAAIGGGTWLVMNVLGVQASLLSGVFAGVLMLIPLLGPLLSLLPPLLATLLIAPGMVFYVMIPIVIFQVIVVNMVMPRIMGNALGLHPLVIIVSLLVGVKLAGFWGAFFAMPLAGIISAFGAFLIRRRQRLAGLTATIVQQDTPDSRSALEALIRQELPDDNPVSTLTEKNESRA